MFKLISRLKIRFLSPAERAEYLREKGMLTIGQGCEIFDNVSFGSEPYLIRIGNKVKITSGVKFTSHDGGMWVVRNLGWCPNADKMGRISIGDNVFIGMNSIIMQNVTIGSNVIIGSGSVVTKDIPDSVVFAGVPAKVICSIEEYYNKNLNRIDKTKHMLYEEKKNYYKRKFGI